MEISSEGRGEKERKGEDTLREKKAKVESVELHIILVSPLGSLHCLSKNKEHDIHTQLKWSLLQGSPLK